MSNNNSSEIRWEHVLDLSVFANNGEFTNIDISRSESDFEKTIEDWMRTPKVTIIDKSTNQKTSLEYNEKEIKALFEGNKLGLHEEIRKFIGCFSHQQGFFNYTNRIPEALTELRGVFLGGKKTEYLLEKNEDGSVDLLQKVDASSFIRRLRNDMVDEKVSTPTDSDKIQTISARFNISYTEDKGLTLKIKECRLTAHSALADELYPDKKQDPWSFFVYMGYAIEFITERAGIKENQGPDILRYLMKDIYGHPEIFNEYPDHFFKLLRAYEKYRINDPVRGRRLSDSEYISELCTIYKETAFAAKNNLGLIDYIQKLLDSKVSNITGCSDLLLKLLETHEKYYVINPTKEKGRRLTELEYLNELYLTLNELNDKLCSADKTYTSRRNLALQNFISSNINNNTGPINGQADLFSKLLVAHAKYCVIDPAKQRRSSTQEYLAELRTIRAAHKPGVFENLLGKLGIKETRRYLLSQSLKSTIKSIEQEWRKSKEKKLAALEDKTKLATNQPSNDASIDDIQKYGNTALKLGLFTKAKRAYQSLKKRLNIANDSAVRDELGNIEKQHAELLKKLSIAQERSKPIDTSRLLKEIEKLNILIKVTQGVTITKEMQVILEKEQDTRTLFNEINNNINDQKHLEPMRKIFLETKSKLEDTERMLKKYEDVTYDQDVEKQLAELRNRYNELLKIAKADNKAVAPTNHRHFMLNYSKAKAIDTLEKELFGPSEKEPEAPASSPPGYTH